VQLGDNATFGDLEEAAKGLGVAQPVMSMSGQTLEAMDTKLLSQMNVGNGAMIQVKGKVDAKPEQAAPSSALAAGAASAAPSSSTAAPAAAAASSSGAASSGAAAAKAPPTNPGTEEKKGPTHLSFESFLRNRKYETGNLAGALSYKPVKLEKGKMNKMPLTVTLQHQKYRHVDHLEYMNRQEIQNFVTYCRPHDLCIQRCGYMYGYYRDDDSYEDGCRAVLEFIYEPEQAGTMDGYLGHYIVDSEQKHLVDKIADKLGLEQIGWVYTALPTDELLTSHEVFGIGQLQLKFSTDQHYSKYNLSKFVTCKITPDTNAGGAPHLAAYMISDQGSAMLRDELMGIPTDHRRCRSRGERPGELIPTVLESGKETTEFDPDWFVVRVNDGAPKKPRSLLNHSIFPVENRPEKQTRESMQTYFRKVAKLEHSWQKYADFHLLLYMAQEFDVDIVMEICNAIRERTAVPEFTEDMIGALLRQ